MNRLYASGAAGPFAGVQRAAVGAGKAPGPVGHAARDQIGVLFRDLRRILKRPLPELAQGLGTRIDVLQALERGDVTGLPPWPETVRIVAAYTRLATIDPGPVLGVLGRAMAEAEPNAGQRMAPLARLRSLARGAAGLAGWTRAAGSVRTLGSKWRMAVTVGAAVVSVIGAAVTLDAKVTDQLAAVSPPLARLKRSLDDYILLQTAPVRDGLKWIEVDDPRTRRGDRLDRGRS